jgi:mycofactocin system transcriptional regulator
MGRPPTTSSQTIHDIAVGLFLEKGFDAVTVPEIASAAGVSPRTFSRYFRSKSDVLWGDVDEELDRLRTALAARPADEPDVLALRRAMVAANDYGSADAERQRRRAVLLARQPELHVTAAPRYEAWRSIVADFVAQRAGCASGDLRPQVLAATGLALGIAAADFWLTDGDGPLGPVIDAAWDELGADFG